jgi:hypothetical protein
MCHSPFSDWNASITESLVDLRNAPVRGIPQRTNQSNHVQAELAMR